MASPYLTRIQNVAVKIESVEGVDESPADADVIAPAFDIEYEPTFEVPERNPLSATFDRPTQVSGERSAVIRFVTELKGSGVDPAGGEVAAPNLSAPFQACGLKETSNLNTSVVYTPESQNAKTVTVEVRQSPRLSTDPVRVRKIIGARGTVSFVAEKGQIVRAEFEFTGKYVEPDTDGAVSQYVNAAITPKPVPMLNAAFTFQGVGTLIVASVNLDVGNSVVLRNDVSDPTGNLMAEITDRAITGSIDPEIVPDAVLNFFKQLTDDVEGVLQYVLGATAGNIVTVKAPKAQVINVAEADRDGLMASTLDLRLNRDAVGGDDALEITMT